jgi:hypothetical protein
LNTVTNGASHRTEIGVEIMHPFGRFSIFFSNFEMIDDMNTFDDEDTAVFLYLTTRFRR